MGLKSFLKRLTSRKTAHAIADTADAFGRPDVAKTILTAEMAVDVAKPVVKGIKGKAKRKGII